MTAHINAQKEDIAKIVLMPGDPKRAKYIADNFLENAKLVTDVRGMLGFTGFYEGKKVTVMASGMGTGSMGIYSYELYNFYDVDTIIRIGSCGSYDPKLNVYDVLLATSCYSESSYGLELDGNTSKILESSSEINDKILKSGNNIIVGRVHSVDAFYNNIDINKCFKENNCLAVEMEAFALFSNARALNKKCACLLTVSDNLVTGASISSLEREKSFNEMITLALKSVL